MTIQSFIEKAIAGGWPPNNPKIGSAQEAVLRIYEVLLDPLAWQAVGKVEGWQERCMDCDSDVVRKETPEYPNLPNGLSWCANRCPRKSYMSGWHHKMHLMITALAEGKTIEQYLETL